MKTALLKTRWIDVYRAGKKYKDEQPIPFIQTIINLLEKNNLTDSKGLYIGCGNGRNFVPLINNGLNLTGLDISDIALKEISEKNSGIGDNLVCSSFEEYNPDILFDYIISIQVFQHGNYRDFTTNIQHVTKILKPGGLLFMRIRSVGTSVEEKYNVVEKTKGGGFSIKYLTGQKKDLLIHFVSRDELEELSKYELAPIIHPYQVTTKRIPPETGTTIHWEGVWKKNF